MFALIAAIVALVILASVRDGEVDIGFFAPMVVDLFSWYVVGAYVGVLPAI